MQSRQQYVNPKKQPTIPPQTRTFVQKVNDTISNNRLTEKSSLSNENTQTLLDIYYLRSDVKIRTCARMFIEKIHNINKKQNDLIIDNLNRLITNNRFSDKYLAQIGVPLYELPQADVKIGETATERLINREMQKIIEQTVQNETDNVHEQLKWSTIGVKEKDQIVYVCLLMCNENWVFFKDTSDETRFKIQDEIKKIIELPRSNQTDDTPVTLQDFLKAKNYEERNKILTALTDNQRKALFNLLKTQYIYKRGQTTNFTPPSPFTAGAITDNFTLELQEWILLNIKSIDENTKYSGVKMGTQSFTNNIASVCLYYLPWAKYTKNQKNNADAKEKLNAVVNQLTMFIKSAVKQDDITKKLLRETMSSLCTVCVMELEEIYYPMKYHHSDDEPDNEYRNGFFSVPLTKYWTQSIQNGESVFSNFKFKKLLEHEINVTQNSHQNTTIKQDDNDYVLTHNGEKKTRNRVTEKLRKINARIGLNPVFHQMNRHIDLIKKLIPGTSLILHPEYIDEFRRTIRTINPTCLENVPPAFLNMVDIPFTREYLLKQLDLENSTDPPLVPEDDMKWLALTLIEIYN